ncbi:MAG: hypothetical protein IID33_10690 [Planctomycetes bacterium]|nr:hypothetical protein [Planctomycetota bacterium]
MRLYFLDRAGIDYEAVKAAGEDNVHDTRSLIDWVVGDGLSAAYLLSHATTAGFALSGTACLVLAWRWGRTNA